MIRQWKLWRPWPCFRHEILKTFILVGDIFDIRSLLHPHSCWLFYTCFEPFSDFKYIGLGLAYLFSTLPFYKLKGTPLPWVGTCWYSHLFNFYTLNFHNFSFLLMPWNNRIASPILASSFMKSVGAEWMLIMVYTNLLGDALWLKKMTVFSRLVMRSAMTPNYALEAHWLCMSTKSNIIVREFE